MIDQRFETAGVDFGFNWNLVCYYFHSFLRTFFGGWKLKTYIGFDSGQKILEGLHAFQHSRADAVAEKASD